MKTKKIDAVQVWKEFEDVLAPRLRLSLIERTVYSHLLRHSRLEGKARLRFSILWLAPNIGVSDAPARGAVRRLIEKRVLRLVDRSNLGHVVEVRLPNEIRGARAQTDARGAVKLPGGAGLDDKDFLATRALRLAIHARERGACFYCLRRIPKRAHCLDHVVPRVRSGRNSYRNLVSCCLECNSAKRERAAGDFLRSLYREGHLTKVEFTGRLRALKALAAGQLRPAFHPKEVGSGKRKTA